MKDEPEGVALVFFILHPSGGHSQRAELAHWGAHALTVELPGMKAARSARQVPHFGASGVRRVIGSLGRSAWWRNRLETRARKKTEVIEIYRWVLSG